MELRRTSVHWKHTNTFEHVFLSSIILFSITVLSMHGITSRLQATPGGEARG